MKINVVRDRSGKVVASFEAPNGHGGSTALMPVLQAGEKIEELEVPDNYRQHLAVLYTASTR